MTEPAIHTTFDTSLIDLSQETNKPYHSNSSTESITSQDDVPQQVRSQTVSIGGDADDWEEAALDSISEHLPEFLSSITHTKFSDRKKSNRVLKIAFIGNESCWEMLHGVIEALEDQPPKVSAEEELTPSVAYSAISFESLDNGQLRARKKDR